MCNYNLVEQFERKIFEKFNKNYIKNLDFINECYYTNGGLTIHFKIKLYDQLTYILFVVDQSLYIATYYDGKKIKNEGIFQFFKHLENNLKLNIDSELIQSMIREL